MKKLITLTLLTTILVLPLAVSAADKPPAQPPPQDASVYPCWDTMQNGHMMPMRGSWSDGSKGWTMMNMQDVQQMKQEITDLRQQVEELKKK